MRVAGPKARFDARFLQLGIHPGGGMTWMLQRIVGPQTATAMTLFGQILDADEAVAHGTGLRQTAEDPLAVAKELAKASAEAPAELVRTIKATMRVTDVLDDHAEAVETELTATGGFDRHSRVRCEACRDEGSDQRAVGVTLGNRYRG